MKLFRNLLIAPATLGLLAPVAASANEVNLNEISNYSKFAVADVENIEHSGQEIFEFATSFNESPKSDILIAGGEGMAHDHGSDSFSSTTTASFSADIAIGAVDGQGTTSTVTDGKEATSLVYGFQIDLNTSFSGEDSLDISIDAGNANGTDLLGELDLNSTSDELVVDGVSYTRPLGDRMTVFVGDNMDGSTLYNTACVYGGPTNTLDDCGNVNSALGGGSGTAFGASFDVGAGFTAAVGYTGAGSSTSGLFTTDGLDAYGAQLTYTGDSYGVSLTYATLETAEQAEYPTKNGFDESYSAINAYWIPSDSSLPSVSVGYEEMDHEKWWKEESSTIFVGLQWDEFGPGTLGAAFGTTGHILDSATEYFMYEAFYSYPVNDGMTITPLVYVKEAAAADETGVIVKTSFSF